MPKSFEFASTHNMHRTVVAAYAGDCARFRINGCTYNFTRDEVAELVEFLQEEVLDKAILANGHTEHTDAPKP
jgi:hypothetical protein